MNLTALQEWLAEPRPALVAAVAEGVRIHVDALRARGMEFYGYALLPGARYDINGLVAVSNTEADIERPPSSSEYRYYRYSVDEWAHWDYDFFAAANELLAEANERFSSMHPKADDDFEMDQFEMAHADALYEAILQGLETAKACGAFGEVEPFMVVWISDAESDEPIMVESAKRLNSTEVAAEFVSQFGG